MYINPKHIIIVMGIIIILMMMYIIHLLKKQSVIPAQQPIIIMGHGNGQITPQPDSGQRQYMPVNNLQSDFFKKSITFASDYLMNRYSGLDVHSLPMDSQQVLSSVNMLSDQLKNNIITAINYFAVDTANASANENNIRMLSSQLREPLWITILRQATLKVVPGFNLITDHNFNPNFIGNSNNLSLVRSVS